MLHFWHTPGHTLESTTILLSEANTEDSTAKTDFLAAFTGDTLFLGDVGRPDLAATSNLTARDLASMMFDSVQRLSSLDDGVVVFPGHGAGSACGKNISSASSCTIGRQKETNYAFNTPQREDFVDSLLRGLPAPADYFFHNVQLNKEVDKLTTEQLLFKGNHRLDPEEFDRLASTSHFTILDCRSLEEFEAGHVPKSLYSPFQGKLAIFAANIIGDSSRPILLVCPEGAGRICIERLARTGVDQIVGYMDDFSEYRRLGLPLESIQSVSASSLHDWLYSGTRVEESWPPFEESDRVTLLDVRGLGEFEQAHVEDSTLMSLEVMRSNFHRLDPERPLALFCAGGLRSVIALSFLKQQGFGKLVNISGGFHEMAKLAFRIKKK